MTRLSAALRNVPEALCTSAARWVVPALAAAVGVVPAGAVVTAPQYAAGISVQTDVGYVDDGSPLRVGYPLFGDAPTVSPNPVDLTFTHISYLRSASTSSAFAGPDNGGTVRAIARTGDEEIGAQAGLNYTFQLQPKAGAVVPAVVPLHVVAIGSTGTENYGSARIRFILSWSDGTTPQSIIRDTGVASSPSEIVTFGGNGHINIDDSITVALNRDISVQMSAAAYGGTPLSDQNLNKDEYGTGSAYVDPVFTLPPAWRDLVNIVGVPASSAPIPEPASWALMLGGFGVIAATRVRRRHGDAAKEVADRGLGTQDRRL